VLHIALIVGVAYLAVAILGFLVIFPILRAGREADRSMAAEQFELPVSAEEAELPAVAQAAAAAAASVSKAPARTRSRRFARRARRPVAVRRPGV
jgi:hypothetical protein